MRLDSLSMFSDAQTLSGSSADSTKTLEVGKAGIAEVPCFVVARFPEKVTGIKTVSLKGCSTKSGTYKTLAAQEVTDLEAGGGVNIPVPQGCPAFLKLVYEGSSMSGKVTAGFTLQAPSPRGARIEDQKAQ